jgi:F-type H+-transporting ATPase subunit delta
MKNLALVKKYAQGLVRAVPDDVEFGSILGELRAFRGAYSSRADLRTALESPFQNAAKRARLLAEVLAAGRAGEKTVRFLSLLLQNKRLDLVGDIVDVLPETWNEEHEIATFEVTSVLPLTAGQKRRLQETLEAAEKGPVSLVFRIDPALLGGLALKRSNIVYDASIRGSLNRMKEHIEHSERSS